MKCLYCGKELPRQRKKYCSRECYSKSGGPTKQAKVELIKICQVCGKEYTGEGDKYCSQACYHKSTTKGKPRTKPRRLCIVCGKPISLNNQRFCSHGCYCKFWAGKQKPNAQKRYINTCQYCGKEFVVGGRNGRHKDAKFCSKECQSNAQKKTGGYRAWQRLSADVIARDGHCVICGNGNRRLQAHHVTPRTYGKWSEFEGVETTEDLIAVCPGCHQSVEALTKAGYKNNPNFNPWELINMVRIKPT